jgi:two-component system, OmpR family, KDP operon response regulator KdpE
MNRKKILVVDDDAVVLKALSMKLTAHGYDVITAEDGSTAVSAARLQGPDLILLDLSFPPDVAHGGGVAWDGFLIMNWLRRLEEARNIPILVITSGDPARFKDRALAAGAVSYLQKPLNNDELLNIIQQTLRDDAGQEQPANVALPQPAS